MNRPLVRIVCITTLVLAAAGSAGAQAVSFGAWGRSLVGVGGSDAGLSVITGTSWARNPRVGFDIRGESANIGFSAGLNVDTATTVAGSGSVWVKPFDHLRIQVGKATWSDLRGNEVFGSFDWLRAADWAGEDLTFREAKAGGDFNTVVSTDIVPHLQAFADFRGHTTQEDALETAQYGAGYTLPGWGQLKAQVIGDSLDKGQYNVALKLTFVPGLTVEGGAYLPQNADVTSPVYAASGRYTWGPLTLHGLYYRKIPKVGDQSEEWGVGVDDALGQGVTLQADVRSQNGARDLATALSAGQGLTAAFVGLSKEFSNGSFGVAFEVSTTKFNNNQFALPAGTTDPVNVTHWAVPVRIDYWF